MPFDVCIDVTKREKTAYQFASAMLEGEHGCKQSHAMRV